MLITNRLGSNFRSVAFQARGHKCLDTCELDERINLRSLNPFGKVPFEVMFECERQSEMVTSKLEGNHFDMGPSCYCAGRGPFPQLCIIPSNNKQMPSRLMDLRGVRRGCTNDGW